MNRKTLEQLASFTRKFHPRGTERLLRLLYSPDKRREDALETIISYDNDLRIHINTGSFIEWKIFFEGHYEPQITDLIKKYLPSGGVFVDVGANVGIHVLVASRVAGESGKVIAIEPLPEARARLAKNISLNVLTNIETVPFVVSDKPGMISFYKPVSGTANQGVGSMYKSHAKGEEIHIEAKTLDEMLRGEQRVDFIKIDTEGHDGKVIKGAAEVIRKHKPVILFEYDKEGWIDAGMRLSEVIPLLKETYFLFFVRPQGLVESREDEDWDSHGFENVLCLPR